MNDIEKRLEQLRELGFAKKNGVYVCEKPIIDGQMRLIIEVFEDAKIKTKIIDCDTDDEYTLHLSESAQGPFVGRVREEYREHLSRAQAVLLQGYRFGNEQSNEIIDYVAKKYGDKPEFPWDDENAIVRRKETGKWYVLIMKLQGTKIGLANEEKIEVMNLHSTPEQIEKMVDGVRFFKGYHMNKRYWFTLVLDKRVSSEEIFSLIDTSYELAKKK